MNFRVSEQRRKRVQELEKEIALNRKRLAEITKLEREKASLQERAQKLAAELLVNFFCSCFRYLYHFESRLCTTIVELFQELKKLRVKMARQMKEEESKFRSWKAKAERELIQMRNRVSSGRNFEGFKEMNDCVMYSLCSTGKEARSCYGSRSGNVEAAVGCVSAKVRGSKCL